MIQIKRLFQQGTEFVPITLAEAVVVNTDIIPGLGKLKITTLDKVLKAAMGVVGTNSVNIKNLQDLVQTINSELSKKQDKLTAGTGITISPEGVISATISTTLYKVVKILPEAAKEHENYIYLKPSTSGINGNAFTEYICIYSEDLGKYVWEQLGEVTSELDLSGYVTSDTFNKTIATINGKLDKTITAEDVTTSNGTYKIKINYDIPNTLYDVAGDHITFQ